MVGAVALILRQPGVTPLETLWAEDGTVFLRDAVTRPFHEVVLAPYAGLAHVVPRIFAEAAGLVPLDFAAAVMSGGAALLLSMLAAFVFRATSCIQNGVVRFAHATSVILLPVAAREVLNNSANLMSFLVFPAFWALVWAPRGWPLRIMAAVVTLMAALSHPLLLAFLPVAGLRLVALRNWKDHVVTAAWAGGLAVQAVVVLSATTTPPSSGPTAIDVAAAYGARVVSVNVLGLEFSQRLWPMLGGLLTVLGMTAFVGAAAYAAFRPTLPLRPLALIALVLSAATFAVPYVIRWGGPLTAEETWTSYLYASRYAIAPTLLLFSAVALLVDRRDPRVGSGRWALVRGSILTWWVVAVAMSFSPPLPIGREAGPTWGMALESSRAACRDGNLGTVDIPITPPGWVVTLGCEHLRE